ncbi:hypothetical protein AGABI2DRAFT_115916 [Agaricus bisporus var. bisporus H97]|uniref:hypothetical protein n=1 Tax=Agaricus bisporus var. bisporus (strain H97 / ATCC MYA-4626 / FGSC 10389) TaxID=936046 RepID=UPI00029F5041|nr:hypothetical protein AGABI2DRAFT_115916 [Agaricus bisporus var. bisporus H97]EKV48866.1 hypothetical protein AGABI2DRAFT_115916 [Agaricus bisporus var. bisporus H97]
MLMQNSQLLRAAQPSITGHQLEDSTLHNYSVHSSQRSLRTSPGQTYYGNGMFGGSHNLAFSDSTFIDNSITSDNFMKEFLQHTIIGAEFDSSDRHPPPRCHPGTRLAIIERCKVFITQCDGKEKMRWVVGAAGVGKSAVLQIVAEEIPADASVFFSVNGRQDGTKLFTTIAYQLATKHEPYRQFLRNEISRDPSLLRKSLPAQFRKFFVDPFIHQHLFSDSQRFLVIIDGLDECDNSLTQRELLRLISNFCTQHPTSPVVWIVATRPEPHITSFFDDERVASAYTKEEIEIVSDEACEDVQRYLRDELDEIKHAHPALRHKRDWPSELEFTRIATAAGGLFAYASTVVRYIDGPHYGDPVAQLCHVLEAIDTGPKDHVLGRDHPMAQLDALYQRILSNIPADAMANTRKLLLTCLDSYSERFDFRSTCNRLQLTEAAAYGAVSYLHAVLKVPEPNKADNENLEYFHKSFPDFLFDFIRSKFSHSVGDEADQLQARCSLRIVEQVPHDLDSMDSGEGTECHRCGYLKASPGFCDNIALSWPGDERYQVTDKQLRLELYCDSVVNLCLRFGRDSKFYRNMSCFHALTTRFTTLGSLFPIYRVRTFAFGEFRSKLAELGKLKQVPLRTLDYTAICGLVHIRVTSPIGIDAKHSDSWNPTCKHIKKDVYLQQWQGWETLFERFPSGPGDDMTPINDSRFHTKADKHSDWESSGVGEFYCLYCSRRLACHFINNPDQLATVFIDSTEMSYVELTFVDPDDDISKWRYRFLHSGRPSCIN